MRSVNAGSFSKQYSDEEIDMLAGWLRAGHSATAIAGLLSAERRQFVSKNGIIGIVHRTPQLREIGFARSGPRVGIPARRLEDPAARVSRQKPRAVAPPKRREPLIERVRPPTVQALDYDRNSRRIELTELGVNDCRFAVNDAAQGEPHLFCGAFRESGSPYCPHHSMRAFNGGVPAGGKVGWACIPVKEAA